MYPSLVEELFQFDVKEFVLLISKTQFSETINNNLCANFTIAELAHLCGMSLSSFKRKFKESPKKHIGHLKLKKAEKLLTTSQLRISEIAYDCGFESISIFNQSFKSYYVKSPSSYRLD